MKTHLRSTLLALTAAACLLISMPSPSLAFGGGACGEGKCSDCHAIEVSETKELLKDLVSEVHGVDFSEVPGLFIIDATGNNGKRGLIYMDFSKSYIISGNWMSIADRTNVSRREMTKLRRVDPVSIPLSDSLIVGNPGAPKKIILFTDPQCPYCEKLHPELARVVNTDPDVVFFIKMMPLVNIHPDAYRISKSILCKKSVQLLEDSFAKKKIPDPSCETDAVDRTLKLAESIGITSTPTLVLPDGRIVPGYRTAEDILDLLKSGQ